MDDKTKQVFITIITALLVSSGVSITGLTVEGATNELDGYYGCLLTEEVYSFARLSGSGERGYPYLNSTKGYKDCKNNITREPWETIESYATKIGIDPYELILPGEIIINENVGVWGESYKIKEGIDPVKI